MRARLYLVIGLTVTLTVSLSAAETIDRIVATVNGRPVMESEMVEALRFEQLLGNKAPQAVPPAEMRAVLARLVDQILITQQMDAANFGTPSAEEVKKRVDDIRQNSSATAKGNWQAWLQSYDLTEADVAEGIALQLRAVQFIEARFRPSVRVEPGAEETYYREHLLPKLKQAGAPIVPIKEVQPRIHEILVQQQMDDLLENWLKALRVESEIRLPIPSSALVENNRAGQAQSAEVR